MKHHSSIKNPIKKMIENRKIFITLCLTLLAMSTNAQKVVPTATYINDNKITVDSETDFTGQAPLEVTFRANPQDMGEHTPAYEWHFRKEGEEKDILVRYEENTQYTFLESGTFCVTLQTSLTDNGEKLDSVTIKVTISESKLEFPNAFSPNGDKSNDIYGAKKDYRSIVEFHAYIFNRWGQKLYEWTDPAGGWDGKYKGNDVKEGVYYVLVKAKGADGRVYNIKKDVNLLRHYIEGSATETK
jgi:gliding motility-associated-like protein